MFFLLKFTFHYINVKFHIVLVTSKFCYFTTILLILSICAINQFNWKTYISKISINPHLGVPLLTLQNVLSWISKTIVRDPDFRVIILPPSIYSLHFMVHDACLSSRQQVHTPATGRRERRACYLFKDHVTYIPWIRISPDPIEKRAWK